MQIWKAHYKDALHDTDIEIINTEEDDDGYTLSFTLDGVKFHGCTPSDFELADGSQYDEAENKFNILKWGGFTVDNRKLPYYYTLERYALDVEIPVHIVRKCDMAEIIGTVCISYEYVKHDMNKHQCIFRCEDKRVYFDDQVVHGFSLCIDGKRYSSEKNTLDFETALFDICRKMKQDYYIKSCFTCQYADYSPYGNDDFGTMLCYRECKENCLKVNSKADYFKYLGDENFTSRQETYLCNEYDLRNKCEGYRGFVDI